MMTTYHCTSCDATQKTDAPWINGSRHQGCQGNGFWYQFVDKPVSPADRDALRAENQRLREALKREQLHSGRLAGIVIHRESIIDDLTRAIEARRSWIDLDAMCAIARAALA